MKLHALGTAGYHPGEHRHTSCFFIPECGIMFDAGTGIFRSTPLIQSDTLHIFLSHAHLDHTFGLTFLLDIVYRTKLKKVFVYAEAEKIEAIQNGLLNPLMFPAALPIEWVALDKMSSPLVIGEANIRWFSLEHPGGSIGYRIDWPELSLAYVTDTTAQENSPYWNIVRNADWLIHECNFCDEEMAFAIKTGHSWTSAVLQGAKQAKVKHLVLTHLQPTSGNVDPLNLAAILAAHQDIGPDDVIVAEDQLCIRLNRA